MLRRRAMMAASGEEPVEPGTDWESGAPYSYELIENEYYSSGKVVKYNGWSRTPYLPCKGATRIVISGWSTPAGAYSGFFDAEYKLIGSMIRPTDANLRNIPDEACFVGISQSNTNMGKITAITPYA